MSTDISNSQLTTTNQGNAISITLEQRQEKLPEPTKASTSLGDVFFSNLFVLFTSATLTQAISHLQMPELTPDRLFMVSVGLGVFAVGLDWALKKQTNFTLGANVASIMSGVCLGGDLL